MKGFSLAVAVGFIVALTLTAISPAHATRRIVMEPNSGYCLSGLHVRDVRRACREFGGRW